MCKVVVSATCTVSKASSTSTSTTDLGFFIETAMVHSSNTNIDVIRESEVNSSIFGKLCKTL